MSLLREIDIQRMVKISADSYKVHSLDNQILCLWAYLKSLCTHNNRFLKDWYRKTLDDLKIASITQYNRSFWCHILVNLMSAKKTKLSCKWSLYTFWGSLQEMTSAFSDLFWLNYSWSVIWCNRKTITPDVEYRSDIWASFLPSKFESI